MNKILALYLNEMIKITHKVVVWIIVILMVVGVFGFGGILKLQESTTYDYGMQPDNKDAFFNEMDAQLEYYKNELKLAKERYNNADTEEEKAMIQSEIDGYQAQIDLLKIAIEKEINLYSQGYRANALNELTNVKMMLANYAKIPDEMLEDWQRTELALLNRKESTLLKIINNKDYKLYISYLNEVIDSDQQLTDEEKQIKKESNNLRLAADPTGEISESYNYDPFAQSINSIENIKLSLLYNIDRTNYLLKPLTPNGREDLINKLAVETYKIENMVLGEAGVNQQSFKDIAVSGMTGFGMFMVVCMILILAGGSISQEISSGSIKSLIISPTRRYKIFIAKCASLLTVGISASFLMYVVSSLAAGVFFGFGGTSFVYAINGVAHEVGFYLYRLSYVGVSFIDVVVYMMFAFMLSIVTRNTAASVGISIAIYFGGNLVNTFLSLISTGEWSKFIPFNNMGLAARIFPDSSSGALENLLGYRPVTPSVTFSLLYLLVLVICFGYTALDSFNRRDIK